VFDFCSLRGSFGYDVESLQPPPIALTLPHLIVLVRKACEPEEEKPHVFRAPRVASRPGFHRVAPQCCPLEWPIGTAFLYDAQASL
jgi:hypothetical protein